MGGADLFVLAAAAVLQPARGAPIIERGDWIAACDNTAACTAMALPVDGGGRAWLSLSRSADPQATAVVRVVVADVADRAVVRLRARGFEADLPARNEDDELIAESRDPSLLSGLIRLLETDARTLTMSAGGVDTSVQLAGGEDALTFIDGRQGRAGGPSALIRRGSRALASPPAPTEPEVSAAASASIAEVRPASFPKSVLARAEQSGCDPAALSRVEARGAWRLSPELMLWSAPCQSGPYNLRSLFLVSTDKGGEVRPAPIPPLAPLLGQTGPTDPPESLLNADFDPKSRILSAFKKSRGLGDCGVLARFVWTGRDFEPLEVDYMPLCRGVTPEAWPVVYRARLKPAP